MKNQFNSIGIMTLLFSVLLFTACKKENVTPRSACDSSNTLFKQLYTNVTSTQGATDDVFMDLVTHEYSFNVTAAATICQVGYQSLPTFNTTPYLIEIFNNSTNQLVYTGSHLFSSTATEYVAITPTALTAGESYTIRRIQTQWNGNIGNTIGRLAFVQGALLNFPFTEGNLNITGSSMYGTGGPAVNFGLPYIDLVFE